MYLRIILNKSYDSDISFRVFNQKEAFLVRRMFLSGVCLRQPCDINVGLRSPYMNGKREFTSYRVYSSSFETLSHLLLFLDRIRQFLEHTKSKERIVMFQLQLDSYMTNRDIFQPTNTKRKQHILHMRIHSHGFIFIIFVGILLSPH